jgi:excisionase family DNA binding protein
VTKKIQKVASCGDDRQSGRNQNKFHTLNEVADQLEVSTRTVRRSIERNELVAHYFGSAVRISESDLKAFIAGHRRG